MDMSTGICEECGKIIFGDEIVLKKYETGSYPIYSTYVSTYFDITYSDGEESPVQLIVKLKDCFAEYYNVLSGSFYFDYYISYSLRSGESYRGPSIYQSSDGEYCTRQLYVPLDQNGYGEASISWNADEYVSFSVQIINDVPIINDEIILTRK